MKRNRADAAFLIDTSPDEYAAADAIEAAAEGDVRGASLDREALWLGSLVAAQMPAEPEAQALLALMLRTEGRRAARMDGLGCLVPLDEQDTALWDARMLDDADLALRRAARKPTLGRYQIEAAIAAAHADRRHGRPTDWAAVVGLYRGLVALHPTTGALTGLAAALAMLKQAGPAHDARYQPWWTVRAPGASGVVMT